MMTHLERTKRYARAFWEQELIDRPYVCVTAPNPNPTLPPLERPVPVSPANTFTACVEERYEDILATFARTVDTTYYAGEALPSFEVTLGPDQFAGFLGSPIAAGEFTTWAHPCVTDWAEFRADIDRSENGYFEKVRRFIAYAATHYRDKFLVNMLDLHSNMDALSALRGPQDLCLDLYDCPEEVMRVLNEVRRLYPEVYTMAYTAGDMEQRGTIGWGPVYSEKKSAVIQCDFSCMISPATVRRYVIPAIEEEAAFLDHSIYHYDGKEALGHLEDILAIRDINCIQWVPGDGQPRSLYWMELLQKIQKAGKSVWIYDWTVEEIKQHFKELEPNKVAFSVTAASPEEADDLLVYLKENT